MLMARRTVDREECGEPIVTAFLFDENILQAPSELNIRVFETYTQEWAEFVMLNRKNRTYIQAHDYDIVTGPIANDKVGLQITRYQLNYIPMAELIRQLSFIRPTFQYYFGTERAIALLQRIEE